MLIMLNRLQNLSELIRDPQVTMELNSLREAIRIARAEADEARYMRKSCTLTQLQLAQKIDGLELGDPDIPMLLAQLRELNVTYDEYEVREMAFNEALCSLRAQRDTIIREYRKAIVACVIQRKQVPE